MISTATIVLSFEDVPTSWIFQYYCGIEEILHGQSIKISSIFRPPGGDKTPSMHIYLGNNGKYQFKDFSTGLSGGALELVSIKYSVTLSEAVFKIKDDYEAYIKNPTLIVQENLVPVYHRVSEYAFRPWCKGDATFWTQFGIKSPSLAKYRVFPLKSYVMVRERGGIIEHSFEITQNYIYGYFREDGTLYKIYQPFQRDRKFIKVGISGYLQGEEQLTYKYDTLLLLSSLKDIMCLDSMRLSLDLLAPDSESDILEITVIERLKPRYKNFLTLLDSDEAGIKAMIAYKETYGLDFVYFNLAKDPSDAVKKLNQNTVQTELIYKINSKLK